MLSLTSTVIVWQIFSWLARLAQWPTSKTRHKLLSLTMRFTLRCLLPTLLAKLHQSIACLHKMVNSLTLRPHLELQSLCHLFRSLTSTEMPCLILCLSVLKERSQFSTTNCRPKDTNQTIYATISWHLHRWRATKSLSHIHSQCQTITFSKARLRVGIQQL